MASYADWEMPLGWVPAFLLIRTPGGSGNCQLYAIVVAAQAELTTFVYVHAHEM